MPSFSLATSTTGRMVAACEISMSDFGFACCSAGLRMSHPPTSLLDVAPGGSVGRNGKEAGASAPQDVADLDAAGSGEFCARDLAGVAADAENLDAAVGAGNREALVVDF